MDSKLNGPPDRCHINLAEGSLLKRGIDRRDESLVLTLFRNDQEPGHWLFSQVQSQVRVSSASFLDKSTPGFESALVLLFDVERKRTGLHDPTGIGTSID